ncbi:MAG: DNA polymerase Y family protein [Rhodobacteraceae bacterium]|nr:DNA polymerase Y family protein [Paracoccaceae bacterium]MCF8513497.1 DNA polymerase Y family protein [Paracoccaceae bacterium]MCF8517603.1 DNA polymerase Y family protein [Paracoccaceae bacterium]
MSNRRILSLWFPRLSAERLLRLRRDALLQPFAVVGLRANAHLLVSMNPEAEAAGLRQGQPLRDATAMCPTLITAPENPAEDAAFLRALRRWAGKFSPWVAEEAPDALVIDLTGCAHLFGGEDGLMAQVEEDCADLGLSLRASIADTRGAAWALARYAGAGSAQTRSGDAIRQEAHATRSRAARRFSRQPNLTAQQSGPAGMIAAPGQTRQALAALPLPALRIAPAAVEALGRLGLRRVEDIMGMPRAALARRFGAEVLRRLDQALGVDPEPVNPAAAPLHFAMRMSFPEPIGLIDDVTAGMDRLLPPLCAKLVAKGRGARRVRLEAQRSDGRVEVVEVGLARASQEVDRIRPLLVLKLDQIDAGFGIDRLRLEAVETEPMHALQHRGHLEAAADVAARQGADTALEDLIGKLGTKLGQEAVVRLHPADSNIPEKSAMTLAAAWSLPTVEPWPEPRAPRPIVIFRPEPVNAPPERTPPAQFRWRRRSFDLRFAVGPERLLPEWWLDDPEWRSGPRDYWRVEVAGGERLWLFYAHGGEMSGGWFCQGLFA